MSTEDHPVSVPPCCSAAVPTAVAEADSLIVRRPRILPPELHPSCSRRRPRVRRPPVVIRLSHLSAAHPIGRQHCRLLRADDAEAGSTAAGDEIDVESSSTGPVSSSSSSSSSRSSSHSALSTLTAGTSSRRRRLLLSPLSLPAAAVFRYR